MCPNQGVEHSLLPECHISNRVLMYSMLHALQSQDRGSEQMDEELRDRFEVFREVMQNYPVPLRARSNYEYVYDALQEHQQEFLADATSSTSMENNVSGSSSVSSVIAQCEADQDLDENQSNDCDFEAN